MPIEIERKFLVTGDAWRNGNPPSQRFCQGYLDSYISAAGIGEAKGTPLFRTAKGKTGQLTENRMGQADAWPMLQRRAREIIHYLENGGALEMAQIASGDAAG